MKRILIYSFIWQKKVFITESHPSVCTDPEYITKLDHVLIGASLLKYQFFITSAFDWKIIDELEVNYY